MVNFTTGRALKDLTTFGIGGVAAYSVEARSIQEMQEIICECHTRSLPFFILGKGSNCLFDDRGLNAVLIINKIDFLETPAPGIFYVGAGYSFSRLGSFTSRNGWGGLEFASGIPASVGGALFMNAGANGGEASQHLVEVTFIDDKGTLKQLKKEELSFSYRHSSFQQMKGAIVAATFKLEPSTTAKEKQLGIIDYRKNTQPYSDKSAGCVFRNPANNFAGALIEKAGLKGFRVGGAEVSPMHGNFIVNREEATAADVIALIDIIRQKVKEVSGVELESEVRIIPYELDHS